MRASLVALLLVLVPSGVLAQVQEWRLCRAEDADHLVIPACTRLIESNTLSRRDRAIAYAIRGKAHWRQQNFDDAIADENEALKLNPNLVAAYVARSAAYVARSAAYVARSGDYGVKEDDDQAIEIDPNVAAAYHNRGIARGHNGDLDGAIADTTRAIEIDPNSALAFISRGDLHSRKRERGLAYADFG
jgi:tetratricopeptide (TPR) repeat protein